MVAEGDDRVPPGGDLLIDWAPRREYPFRMRLHREGGQFIFIVDEVGWYRIDPGQSSITVSRMPDPIRREAGLWGVPAALCAIVGHRQTLHAAAVDVNGAAVLLAAPGRFGKTTLAAAFLRAGYRLLSEDFSCCQCSPVPTVLPGPALLRIRRDVFERSEFPGTQIVAQHAGRTYLVVDDALRGDGAPVPLKAIIFLHEWNGEPTVERRSQVDSVRDLWALSFRLPTQKDSARCFESSTRLASNVPAWNLHRRLDLQSLPQVVHKIVQTCLS